MSDQVETRTVEHGYRNGALVDIEADVLDAIHRVFLSSGLAYCFAQQPNPTSKGAPFHNACPARPNTLPSAATPDS